MVDFALLASVGVPCCGVLAVVGLVAVALLNQRRRAGRFAHAWAPFAAQVGGRLIPGGIGRSTRVHWAEAGASAVLESYQRSGGSSDRTPYTRLRLLPGRQLPTFALRSRPTREPGLIVQDSVNPPEATGQPALDDAFVISQGDPAVVGRAFDADLMARLRSQQADTTLWLASAVREGQPGLEIEERGDVNDPARLLAWRDILVRLYANISR